MRGLLAAVAASLAFAGSAGAEVNPNYSPLDLAPTTVCHPGGKLEMFCLHAWTRKARGLPPLIRAPQLYQAALAKSQDDELCHLFSHDPCGKGWDAYIDKTSLRAWGENIAAGFPTIRQTYDAWLHSQGHFLNIVNPAFTLYGSGYVAAGPFPRMWTVDLGG